VPYLTAIGKSKATPNPWFSRLLQPGNEASLFWDTYTNTYLAVSSS